MSGNGENCASVEINVYDERIVYTDCTVEILRNSVTGKESVGWWRNDQPPIGMEVEN